MSVTIVEGLAAAFQALTGMEAVNLGTRFMINNGGNWASVGTDAVFEIVKNSGAKIIGANTSMAHAYGTMGGVTGLDYSYLFDVGGAQLKNCLATPAQLSNATRAALQNGGAQIGNTALKPVTDLVVQSTGGANQIAVTSKGVLAKVAFESALYSAAAAFGVTLGIGIVETNPKFVTSVYNKLFNDNVNPEEIADIVENTTVWQNIRDGIGFLAEDFLNAVKGSIEEVVVSTSSVRQDGIFPEKENGSFINNSGSTQVLLHTETEFATATYTNNGGSDRYIKGRWVSYTVSPRSVGYGIQCTGGTVNFVPAGTSYNPGNNTLAYPEHSTAIDRVYITIGTTRNYLNINASNYYPVAKSTGDGPGYIEHRADNSGESAVGTRARLAPLLLEWMQRGSLVETIPSDGISDKPNAQKPTPGNTISQDYPAWDANSIETISDWDDENDRPNKRKWFPVAFKVDQSTGQDEAQDGTISEDDLNDAINNVDNALEENTNTSPETETQPDVYPNPNPTPQPGTELEPVTPNPPSIDTSDGESPDPTIPILSTVATSGLAHIYNPTLQEVKDLGAVLWTPSLIENIKKIFVNPMDGIIGFHILYATPKTTEPEEIVLGYYGTGVNSKVVTNQYITVDCGTVDVNEWWNDARDYEPYVNVSIYLPFIGIVPLKANDVIGSHIHVKYHIDVLTGTCLAMVEIQRIGVSGVLYQFVGNCAINIPLSSGNYTAVITSLLSVASSAVGGAAIGGVGGALFGAFKGGAINAGRAKLQVIQSGNLGANAGAMGIRKPFLIVRRPVTKDAYAYNMQYGYPAFKWVTLGQMKGFTRVKSVHLNDVKCTDEEKDMIEGFLKEGVLM